MTINNKLLITLPQFMRDFSAAVTQLTDAEIEALLDELASNLEEPHMSIAQAVIDGTWKPRPKQKTGC